MRTSHILLTLVLASFGTLLLFVESDVVAQRGKSAEPLEFHGVEGTDAPQVYARSYVTDQRARKAYGVYGIISIGGGDVPTLRLTDQIHEIDFRARKPEWKLLSVSGSKPSARTGTAAAIHSRTRKIYMFGGLKEEAGAGKIVSELWELDLARLTWRQIEPEQRNPRAAKGAERDVAADWPSPLGSTEMVIDETANMLYVYGGRTRSTETEDILSSEFWSYDIRRNTWSQIEAKGEAVPGTLMAHSLTMLRDGRLILVGGSPEGRTASSNVFIFDPKKSEWTKVASLPEGRRAHVAAWNNKIRRLVVANGGDSLNERDTIFLYDPSDDTWTTAGRTFAASLYGGIVNDDRSDLMLVMPGRRSNHEIFMYKKTTELKAGPAPEDLIRQAAPDGTPGSVAEVDRSKLPKTVEAGEGPGEYTAGAAFYDPVGNRLVYYGGMRLYHHGKELSMTEYSYEFRQYDMNAEPGERRWDWIDFASDSRPDPRAYFTSAFGAKTQKFYVFGGIVRSDPMQSPFIGRDLWVFDLKSREWKEVQRIGDAPWPDQRSSGVMVLSDDEKTLWMYSGARTVEPTITLNRDLWKFEIEKGQWSQVVPDEGGSSPTSRFGAKLLSVGGDKAILFGGRVHGANEELPLDVWELNLKTGAFARKRAMLEEYFRIASAAAWEPRTGRILVANGNYTQPMQDVIAYDPKSDGWSFVGVTSHASGACSAAVDTRTGDFYLMGGNIGNMYDPIAPNKLLRWSPDLPAAGAAKPDGEKD
jgi:N-acetylneuraminic acid mutarotase